MIELRGATKVFPGTEQPAVDGLDLAIPEGELVVLVGPSGCGKTTTLKMINRIIEPSSGAITVGGRDVLDVPAHELRRDIGYVIQQIGLFPHRTIEQNIGTVPKLVGWDAGRTRDRVTELLELMDLDPALRTRYPAELSGGQRQRVGVARALAADPPVLLMDEPYGAVDPLVRGRLQDQLVDLQRDLHKTIVLVTHDVDEAVKLGDRIAILNLGGHLEQYATPEEVLARPANDFVTSFIGDERGLRRLSLFPVAEVGLLPGPAVPAEAGVDEAKRIAAEAGTDWIGVLDGARMRGWVWVADLDPARTTGEHETRDFRVWIQSDQSLRAAVDAIVGTRNQVAIVHDGDTYLGMLTIETVSRELLA
ncbi:ABC transporter ATP-binding protein [Nitriliruptoraceae bacterium ZYF776]|nr:ABC transporter ATP-binding protein [Profundirhabdus halotolerans]